MEGTQPPWRYLGISLEGTQPSDLAETWWCLEKGRLPTVLQKPGVWKSKCFDVCSFKITIHVFLVWGHRALLQVIQAEPIFVSLPTSTSYAGSSPPTLWEQPHSYPSPSAAFLPSGSFPSPLLSVILLFLDKARTLVLGCRNVFQHPPWLVEGMLLPSSQSGLRPCCSAHS